jgi:hypothetical protein
MRICPQPVIWHQVFERLQAHAHRHACVPAHPPIPLILGGWAYSNDTEKLHRWEATVQWADKNGCSDLLKDIAEDQFYCVESPTTYTVGSMGGPMYREWDFQPRNKPDVEILDSLLKVLRSRWVEIAGPEISSITQPIQFDGAKARRLVVLAKSSATPPWGAWTKLASDENKRRSFTRLRASVNAAIAPHEVDHIDFQTQETLQLQPKKT